jgi:hypothetical protein
MNPLVEVTHRTDDFMFDLGHVQVQEELVDPTTIVGLFRKLVGTTQNLQGQKEFPAIRRENVERQRPALTRQVVQRPSFYGFEDPPLDDVAPHRGRAEGIPPIEM